MRWHGNCRNMTVQETINYTDDKARSSKRRNALDDVIADGLTKIRINSGLKQNELAQILGIKPQMVSRYERKESIVPFGVAYEIASKLGVPLDNFFANIQQNGQQYGLSDNQQDMINDYFANSDAIQSDIEKFKQAYFSIKDPKKRSDFMSVIENVVNTYKD